MNSMKFEIFIDSLFDNNKLFKDQFMILLLNCYELSFFIIKINIIDNYIHQDLRKLLIEIIFE